MRAALVAMALILSGPAFAQDQTLADIRAELAALAGEVNVLRQELVATGAAGNPVAGADSLARMDALEAELVRLTAKAEEIELRVNRVVTDGTNRIGDLEFRLCEVTPGCDIATLGETSVLGGAAAPAAPADDAGALVGGSGDGVATDGGDLAMNEQADFDRAKEAMTQGDFQGAADQFTTFTQNYPGSPLTAEAQLNRGDALANLGDTANSARAYLEAFNADEAGPMAPDSLLRLGEALGLLGQNAEACVTLREVGARFPTSMAATQAQVAMQGLACQ